MKAPFPKKGEGKKAPPFAKKGKAAAEPTMAEGDAAPKRADRPARKMGGAAKKGC